MSFGKIYSYSGNPRTTSLLAVAKENGLDIEFVDTEPAKGVSTDYLKINKLGKVPTFEGADGFVLSETIAIAVYLASQNEKTSLLGKTKQDYATILRWMSFANTEVLTPLGGWFRPIIGRDPYNKKNVDDSQKAALKAIHVLEEHLLTHTYLVGERLTLADLFAASIVARGFQYFFDKKWRSENPNVTRWYETIYNTPSYSAVAGKLEFIEEAIKNVAPKKEQAPKAEKPKAAAKPKAAEPEEEDEAPSAPKPKHPLEALPRSTFVLDDWKRKYSNEETREVALPWFWENVNFEEYSLWTVDYKYNDELTLTFMTANLIGGFFARLEASRKYIFGCASVYGEANNSIIKGAFLVRGQEALPAFDVAPDFESYEFTKLDPTKDEDKKFVEDQWSWDKPLVVDGKTYEWADGKVICLGAGGGPTEDNVTGFLVRSTATKWSKNSVLAVDAGSHLAAITRILEQHFPLVSEPRPQSPPKVDSIHGGRARTNDEETSPTTQLIPMSDDSGAETPLSDDEMPLEITTLLDGVARANALHVVREHVSTYLITHPHLDHLSGFVVNTAAFHNTSRPKRLAALPFTVQAIKTHIFNNIIWPNLTDEDGGVGLVSFQRLAEGGNIALGQGKEEVSHGHCMRGPGHVHRGSNADLQEMPGLQHASAALHQEQDRRSSYVAANNIPADHCVIDSSAFFIRTESTMTTPTKEILIFGDIEPDSLSLSPRTAIIWAEAAPKIAAGILTGIFIECSYTDAQADAVLFGHLSPRHLLTELQNLADLVKTARTEHEQARESARQGRKRKRASIDTPLSSTYPHSQADDDLMTDYAPSNGPTGTHTPNPPPSNPATSSAQPRIAFRSFESPLKGLKVVIIHVKDTCEDGPLVGDTILRQLREGEAKMKEQGRGLGCCFEISKSGDAYWF
ncbi:hypothetical protein EJ07DRAFT_169721 [Lizonia empirigonia]|nr:hypothetical protein EJ07DRAFT_169721 [Lizonia empirigonia]